MIVDCTTAFRATHLGMMIAGDNPGRIIAMPTSEVYADPQLLPVPKNHLDNGIQAQLYVNHGDTLVVYYPHVTADLVERISENLLVNSSIWEHLTGISIRPKELVIAYETSEVSDDFTEGHISLKKGSLLGSSIEKMGQCRQSILGFVFTSNFLAEMNRKIPASALLEKLAKHTDFLMDKNHAMEFLNRAGINIPKTYTFERASFSVSDLGQLNESELIFKPSGGAAGIGLFPGAGTGASPALLREHLRALVSNGTLPGRFQIQEFIDGPTWGAMGLFLPGRKWQILQIHTQQMDNQGRFIGGRWDGSLEAERLKTIEELFSTLENLDSFEYQGLIEFDLIGKKVIEVNPRITASSPIFHLLSLESKLQEHRGKEFRINQIDINTHIQFPEDREKLAQVVQIIVEIQEDAEVLILPQGINPVGKSRILFVNDNKYSSSQFRFLNELDKL